MAASLLALLLVLTDWRNIPETESLQVATALASLDTPCSYQVDISFVSAHCAEGQSAALVAAIRSIHSCSTAGDAWLSDDNLARLKESILTVLEHGEDHSVDQSGVRVNRQVCRIVHASAADLMLAVPEAGARNRLSHVKCPTFYVEHDPINRQLYVGPRDSPALLHTPRSLVFPLLNYTLDPGWWSSEFEWQRRQSNDASGRILYKCSTPTDPEHYSLILLTADAMLPLAASYSAQQSKNPVYFSVYEHSRTRDGGVWLWRTLQVTESKSDSVALRVAEITDVDFEVSSDDVRLPIPSGTRLFDHRLEVAKYWGDEIDGWPPELKAYVRAQ